VSLQKTDMLTVCSSLLLPFMPSGCVPSDTVPSVHHCVHHLCFTPQGAVSVLRAFHAVTGAALQRAACHKRQRGRVPLRKYLVHSMNAQCARSMDYGCGICQAASADMHCLGRVCKARVMV
jgi:hypothetical protein